MSSKRTSLSTTASSVAASSQTTNSRLAATTSPASSSSTHHLRSSKSSRHSSTNEVPPSSKPSEQPATNEPTTSNNHLFDQDEELKKKPADSFFQRIKKRPISGVLTSDSDTELTCPICFDLIDVAHVTKCGHSFCLACIQTALEHTHRCPKCNTPCTFSKDIFPNFTLNQIIERVKDETNIKKSKITQSKTSNIIEFINSAQDDLNIEDVNQLLTILSNKREELKYTNKKVSEMLLHDFLKHLQQVKTEELNRIQHELQMVNEDCKKVEENITTLKVNKQLLELDKTNESSPETQAASTSNDSKSPNKIQAVLTSKKRIVHRYFDELSQTYVQAYNRDLNMKDFNIRDCTTKGSSTTIALDQIRETVSKITDCSEFRCIASVNYNSDIYSLSSIVSSVDFDRSYEHFAIAGVTKRIKIFDFENILERPHGVHYPQYEMVHNAKLSCVSWNRYFRQQLACSDYEGVVTLWDSEQGTLIRTYQEHEKRCWGVQFCNVDPRLLASASDDSKVKIWSTNSEYSLLSIDAKSNVCCVVFKPDSKFHVLFGTADHSIHYYDLRNPKEAVSLFKGHRKAVSYVKFCSETSDEFVSASTDSHLKMWKLNEGQCVRSFTGHVNEKNFVGLEAHNGYIVTGSENNTCYLYCNELSKPLLTYKFDDGSNYPKKDESMNDFVSAVCWSNQNHLLAANSQGIVKVLELV